mmetsp:Transcript_25490/g.80078  ORF Transcript_25490/g.80078 Transcript_25490/m.80078 type:complete len:206 (+) Transcript_25490:156-773(+)
MAGQLVVRDLAVTVLVGVAKQPLQVLQHHIPAQQLPLYDLFPVALSALDHRIDEDAHYYVRERKHREEYVERKDQGVAPVDRAQRHGDFNPADTAGRRHEERVNGRRHVAEELDELVLELGLLRVIPQVARDVLRKVHAEDIHVDDEQHDGPHQALAGVEHGVDHHAQLPEKADDPHYPKDPQHPQHAKEAHSAEFLVAAAGFVR